MPNQGNVAVPQGDGMRTSSAQGAYFERRKTSSIRSVWKWVLRLSLPLLIGLSIEVLDWLWVDNVDGTRWLDIVGGSALTLGLASIAVWCACEWLDDTDVRKKP
jgi:hypothetical protein